MRDNVWASFRTNYLARRLVTHAEYEESSPLIRDCDAVLTELFVVILLLRFFEFQPLILGSRLPPDIDLFGSNFHSPKIVRAASTDPVFRTPMF